MIVTIFGALVPAIGALLLWRGSLVAMLVFVMAMTLMGGSATVILTALGNSSVQPGHMALLFLMIRCLAPGREPHHGFWPAAAANGPMLLFAGYGALGALLLPRIFAGVIDVTPLRPIPGHGLNYTLPLAFSNQNITVAVYLVGTIIAAVTTSMVMGRRDAWRWVARAAAAIGTIHALLGLATVVIAGPVRPLIAFFRNGFYAQLSHSVGGYDRMTGIFPEAANYAAYALLWLVFLTELWLRRVETRFTGPAALLLGVTLLLSSSSTAYVGFAAYGLVLLPRLLLGGGMISGDRLLGFVMLGLAALAAALGLSIAAPQIVEQLGNILELLTVDKLESASGRQRAFWAKQGLDAFVVSYGLGVGVGSFRSSSLFTAIIGSVGIVGALAFVVALWRIHMPWRRSTWVAVTDGRAATGAAASWAALIGLAPASVAAPSPDPGLTWGLIAGIALGLRAVTLRHETVTPVGQGNSYDAGRSPGPAAVPILS